MEEHTPQSQTDQKTFKVTKSVKLEEGRHTGEIVKVEFRTDPYQYTDIFVAVDGWVFEGKRAELKYGVATNFSENAQLVQLMGEFGRHLKEGDEVSEEDVRKVFVGKKVSFVTFNEKNNDKSSKSYGKEFSRIVQGSFKLQQ